MLQPCKANCVLAQPKEGIRRTCAQLSVVSEASQAKRKPKPTPSLGQEIPVVPWTKLASDIFHFQNDSYLLIVDFTSQFPIVCKLKSMTAKHVVSHFSEVFGEYRWPDTLLTDNGPCYASYEFKQLMFDMSVNHITSSPHYPQSDG